MFALSIMFSAVYQFVYCIWIAIRLPLWLFGYMLIPSRRTLPKRTLRQFLLIRVARDVIHMRSVTKTCHEASASTHGTEMVIVKPGASPLYRDVLDTDIQPVSVGGTWYPRKLGHSRLMEESSHIMLHMHGGAFVMGSGRQDYLGFLCSTMLECGKFTAIFAPDYRLSSGSSSSFPAALQDMLTSYPYLVNTTGVPSDRLIISGDSAGANLTIAFLRYLSQHAEALRVPIPAHAILISPWVAPNSLTDSNYRVESSPHFDSDYLPHSHLSWGANAYIGYNSASNPYISPMDHPFSTPVKVLVSVGTSELFTSDVIRWMDAMRQVEGNDITLNLEEGAPHDTLLMGSRLGWVDSARSVATAIGSFVQE